MYSGLIIPLHNFSIIKCDGKDYIYSTDGIPLVLTPLTHIIVTQPHAS